MTKVKDRVETQDDTQLATPRTFTVVLLNDDFTSMEFVVDTLQAVFNMSALEATTKTIEIHVTGEAACGAFPAEIAEIKADKVIRMARENEFPLMAVPRPL